MTSERTRYFAGQLLDENDLTQEQQYFREKLRRHNRMLHGWGIVSGLGVSAGPAPSELTVEPGYALDSSGDEIVVSDAVIVDLLSEDHDGHERKRVRKRRSPGRPLYLGIRYAEHATRPVPAGDSVEYSRTRESFAIRLLTRRAEPWVILAEVVLDRDLKVSTVDCHAHERRVIIDR